MDWAKTVSGIIGTLILATIIITHSIIAIKEKRFWRSAGELIITLGIIFLFCLVIQKLFFPK